MSAQLETLCARGKQPQSLLANGKREKEFFTVKEVAEAIGTSDKSVRRLQKRAFFKSSSALRTKQIPRSEIERYKAETVQAAIAALSSGKTWGPSNASKDIFPAIAAL